MSEDIREQVRQKYAEVITVKTGGCCCGGDAAGRNLYRPEEVAGLPPDAVTASFGCGNPIALAELHEGETVLDLGSGAGLDVLLSARRVGPSGKAYGLDMTDEMLAQARANQVRAGLANVEFLRGNIEAIPLPDNAVDVIISNCVINLSGDKDRVLQEAYRVLKPGGRLAVSDTVLTRALPQSIAQSLKAWTACIAGALRDEEYREKLKTAGFVDITIDSGGHYDLAGALKEYFPGLPEAEILEMDGSVVSAFIRAHKPA